MTGKREKTKGSKRDAGDSRLLTIAAAIGLVLAAVVLVRVMAGRGTFGIYAVGGTVAEPWALTKHYDKTWSDNRHATGNWTTLVFAGGRSDPRAEIDTGANPGVYGIAGDHVWLGLVPQPALLDVREGQVTLWPAELEQTHAPLANGFEVARPNHRGFVGSVHTETGSIALEASNSMRYVLDLQGRLTPWEQFEAAHPAADAEASLAQCLGGRFSVCGTKACVRLEADPGGGEVLAIENVGSSEVMFGPQIVAGEGCIPTAGPQGPIVLVHQSQVGRDRPKDQITAIDLQGKTAWTVSTDALFVGQTVKSQFVGVVDDGVVVAAEVSHWWHGSTAIVASIARDGTVTPAS